MLFITVVGASPGIGKSTLRTALVDHLRVEARSHPFVKADRSQSSHDYIVVGRSEATN
jgi:hypothetical protein